MKISIKDLKASILDVEEHVSETEAEKFLFYRNLTLATAAHKTAVKNLLIYRGVDSKEELKYTDRLYIHLGRLGERIHQQMVKRIMS